MKEEVCKKQPTTSSYGKNQPTTSSLGENCGGKISPYPKIQRKELTVSRKASVNSQAERAEPLSDPEIRRQLKKMGDCLNKIIAIRKEEGYDASFDSVWAFVVAKIKEQLAGVDSEDFTEEEIDLLSEIGFYKEVLKKVMKMKKR